MTTQPIDEAQALKTALRHAFRHAIVEAGPAFKSVSMFASSRAFAPFGRRALRMRNVGEV